MEFQDYHKYRWFFTSSGKLVIGGKSAEQNDFLINKIKGMHHEFIVMHTSSPGSPFSVILDKPENVSTADLEETAVFTGCFSKAWKFGKKKEIIDIFRATQLHKSPTMKTGTWGLNGKIQKTTIQLKLNLTKQKGRLRAVPVTKKPILTIIPGNIDKSELLAKLSIILNGEFSQEEILSAIPAGGVKILK